MKNGLPLPAVGSASWIWNSNNTTGSAEEFVLFRKEFTCDSIDLEVSLHLASPCCCRIFVNGTSVGFGPSAHPEHSKVYADTCDISDYIECGNNMLAILAWHDPENSSTPGIWAELTIRNTALNKAAVRICTGADWDSAPGSLWPGMAPHLEFRKTAGFRHYTGTVPGEWMMPGRAGDARCWKTPDIVIPIAKYPLSIDNSHITPPVTGSEEIFLKPVLRGKVTSPKPFSRVELPLGNRAAIGFIYRDEPCVERCAVRCRREHKIFVNGKRMFCDGSHAQLLLNAGWNEIQLFISPGGRRQDMELEFSDSVNSKGMIYPSADCSSEPGWSITRPLKISFSNAGWILRSGTLIDGAFRVSRARYSDDGSILRNSIFSETGGSNFTLLEGGDCIIYELDEPRYGFLHLKFTAPLDTVINILAGTKRSANGLVESGNTTGADIRIAGVAGKQLEYRMPLPCDCRYVAIKVSAMAKHTVEIHSLSFWELARRDFADPGFNSSDEFLNMMWAKGCNMLRRASANVAVRSARPRINSYLFDAYMLSAGMACMTGSSTYLVNRLKQCLDAQLENGAIPALEGGRRAGYQLPHLLFLPAWINEAYRYSADRKLLNGWVEKLDLVREFYESLLDPEYSLLRTPDNWDRTGGRISSIDFSDPDNYYSCLSALFCRFMLNASDTYMYAGLNELSEHCLAIAKNVSDALRSYCYLPEHQMFTTTAAREGEEAPSCDAFSNFCMLYSGIMDVADYEKVFNHFLNAEPPYDRTGEINSAYFHVLLSNSLFSVGLREYVFEYLTDRWKRCISNGDDAAIPDGTRMIPPNMFLQRYILGVRIGDNGQSTVFFKPAYDLVKHASGVIPFPCGNLKVGWQLHDDGHLSVTLDANVPLKVVPELSMARLADTEFQLSEHITLLKPPENTPDY